MSLFLFNTALATALGEALTPVIVDPCLIWIWAELAVASAEQTVIFHWTYRKLDNDEYMTYGDDSDSHKEYMRNSLLEQIDEYTKGKGRLQGSDMDRVG